MWVDLRLALRQAKRRPAYAWTCIAVLALGLGACTTVFSALYAAVLKPLPYADPDRLVSVHNRFRNGPLLGVGASAADYFSLRQHHELFRDAGAYYFLDLALSGVEIPQKINAVAISSSLLQVLGAEPLMGRTFSEVEQRFNGPHAVILSESYWESEFARDPAILHGSLRLNGELFPVIGVMPKSFVFPNDVTQMWTPLALRDPNDNRSFYLRMYARLAPGLDFEHASARLVELGRQMEAQNPQLHAGPTPGWSYFLRPVLRTDDPSVRRWLWILFTAVGCLLLIVCSNVAGLVLARSSERQADLAVRVALGASRWRLARQALMEVLLLSGCGGIAGLGLARAGVALLGRYAPTAPPHIETPVFLFCIVLALLSGVICGIYPALDSSASAGLRYANATARTGRRWRQALIVVQVGVATALLVCGGLLIHSLVLLLRAPLGFDPRDVLTMYISLPRSRYATAESRARFFDAVIKQTAASGGVDAASACTLLPFGYGENLNTFEIVGRPKPTANQYVVMSVVFAGYFQAMRIPLLRGQAFTPEDRLGTAPVVLIDETFARRVFAGEDPLGRQVKMGWGDVYTIAGVVGAVKTSGIDVDGVPTVYFSAGQTPVTDMTLAIRSHLPNDEIVRDVQRIVSGIDRDQPIYDVATLRARIDRSLQTRRFVVWLMLGFAISGTALAALGLYGLLSYTIILRRREIGIRMALGAGTEEITMLVCRSGMALVAAGMVLGAGTALAAYRWISSQMYGVGVQDGVTWLAVLGIMGASGLAASAIPAWRAARSSPTEALKTS
jgi:putative ABC transport system permease protein